MIPKEMIQDTVGNIHKKMQRPQTSWRWPLWVFFVIPTKTVLNSLSSASFIFILWFILFELCPHIRCQSRKIILYRQAWTNSACSSGLCPPGGLASCFLSCPKSSSAKASSIITGKNGRLIITRFSFATGTLSLKLCLFLPSPLSPTFPHYYLMNSSKARKRFSSCDQYSRLSIIRASQLLLDILNSLASSY